MRRVLRGSVAGVVLAAAVATVGLVPAERVAAAPALTIEPAGDLVDGQRVTIGGSGFPAEEFVYLAQCSADVVSIFDGPCRYAGGEVDGNGDLTAQILVRAILGAGQGPEIEVDCRAPDACVVVAAVYDPVVGDYEEVARTALPFDPDAPLAPPPTITVEPREGLVDGQNVDVSGEGVVDDSVTILQCTADPAGWSDCDDESASFVPVPDGSFTEPHQVFAVVAAGSGELVDCRSADPGACVLAVLGDDNNWGAVTTVPLGFDPDGPLLPPPTLTVTPAEDLVDGQQVQVEGRGFAVGFEGQWVQLHQCAPDPGPGRCRTTSDRFAELDEQGGFTTTMPVTARVPTDDGLHDCRTGAEPCELVATTANVGSPRAGRAELRFDPDAPVLPDPTIEVAPASGLGDFTPVTVTGGPFASGSPVSVQVCRVGGTDEDCDWTNGESPTAGADGRIDTEIAVFADAAGSPGRPSSLDCRAAPGCELVATDGTSGLSARLPLDFGPPDAPRGRYRDPVFDDVEVTRDLLYRQTVDYAGNPIDLELDIYRPAGDTATVRPAIVWMYGGWFSFGDKTDDYIVDFATESARRGYVGVAINYRERPNTSSNIPQLVAAMYDAYDDAVAAVDWLKADADEYGIDPDAIAASGWSAGAVTSLNLAYLPGERGPATSPIAAALPIAGVMLPRIDPGEPPTLAFYGTDDTTLPPGTNNTNTMCPSAEALGIGCEVVTYDGDGHGIVNRSADIVRRGTDFVVDQVLDPSGYFAVAADAGGPYTVDEGSVVTLDGAGSSGAGLSYAWSPGARVDDATSATPALRGVDDGTETVELQVANHHGVTAGASADVVTRNVAPTISDARTSGATGATGGRSVTLSATVTDPGTADTHTATVDWGDGRTGPATVDRTTGAITVGARHDYATAGPYRVTLTVADDDGGSATWTGAVDVGCTVNGTDRADLLVGTRRADTVCGLGGDDVVLGMGGDDVLLGGPGNDLLVGGPGDDDLDGQAGWDLVIGGGGADTCAGELRLSCRQSRPRSGP
jgi:acetyl esterase/lipase